jgi:hypothetical protein
MRLLSVLIALALISGAPVAFAQDDEQDHSAHHPAKSNEPEAAPLGGYEHGTDKMSALQENMINIESLMQQIRQTSDPARKRELLGEHLQALQQEMRLVVGQRAAMKMSMKENAKSDSDMQGGMMKDGGGMMKGGMMMHKKVEQRLDLMGRLLQQMIEREVVEAELAAR